MAKDIYEMAETMIRSNPRFKNDPTAQQVLQIIHNRDATKGIEIANELLKQQGVDRDTGVQQALNFFGMNNS